MDGRLAGAAILAAAAGAGADDARAAAGGAGGVHVDACEGFLEAFGVGAAGRGQDRCPLAGGGVGDDVDDFLLAGAREVGDRAVDGLLLHLIDPLHREIGLEGFGDMASL
jgi:hypothetical protein